MGVAGESAHDVRWQRNTVVGFAHGVGGSDAGDQRVEIAQDRDLETVTFLFPRPDVAALVECLTAGSGNALVANGTATATLTAPTTPGTYTGSAIGSLSGPLGEFGVTVVAQAEPTPDAGGSGGTPTGQTPAGSLPATGSNGVGTLLSVAIGLLVVGLGLSAVTSVRRRSAFA